jgi:2-hydroxychromene-2-carboxylate isomerase
MAKSIKFYFDAISPYAWLAWRPLLDVSSRLNVKVVPVPVVFAGLLGANGSLGPAEIPNKRLFLIKDVMRRASTQGMKATSPPSHPFNPLLALRVASLDMEYATKIDLVTKLLDAPWRHGLDISNTSVVSNIATSVGLNGHDCLELAKTAAVKDKLREQTEEAVAAGVFGVPTTVVDGEIFWGSESDSIKHIELALLGCDDIDLNVVEKWRNIVPSAVRKR